MKLKKVFNRAVAFIIAAVLTVMPVVPAFAADSQSQDTYTVQNKYVQFTVNSHNGGYVIKTVDGSLIRKSDQNKNLLFQGSNYDTSFTTIRVNGKDYIYGNSYGFMGMDGVFTSQPHNEGNANLSTWKIGDIEVTQSLELINDTSNPYLGNVKIKYTVKNSGSSDADIGSRVLLDTMLDNNDGAPVELGNDDRTLIKTEKAVDGKEIPQYWKSFDNYSSPGVVSYGFTSGWGNTAPDKMLVGHWNGMASTKWDYTPTPALDFTSKLNSYGGADSAVAYYWNPVTLKAGEEKSFETMYGILSNTKADANDTFSIKTIAQRKIELNAAGNGYENDGVFEVTAEVDNTLANSKDLSNVTAAILMEDGLSLADGEASNKFVQSVAKNGSYAFKWKLKASPQASYQVKKFKVDIQPSNYTEPVSDSQYILIPSIQGKAPDALFTSITPERLYYSGEKYITAKGSGFKIYSDKGNYDVYLEDMNGNRTLIPDDNVTIIDDTQMIFKAFGDFSLGEYTVKIVWSGGPMKSGTVQTLPIKISMTSNKEDANNYYGLIAVVKSSLDTYALKTFKNEQELKAYKDAGNEDKLLLTLRGHISEVIQSVPGSADNGYIIDAMQTPVIINNIVQYSGNAMSIKKEKNEIKISGDGDLCVIGALTFWKWGYEINFQDGEKYTLSTPEIGESEIKISLTGLGSLIQSISGFTMDLKYGIFQSNEVDGNKYNVISFGGRMSLPVFPSSMGSSTTSTDSGGDDELGGFSVDINNVLFGEKANKEPGFIGVDTTVGIKLPKDAFGGIIESGLEGELTINTIDNIYGVEFNANILIIECEAKLTIKLFEGIIPVPDELQFTAGGDPGIPIIPGVVYVTRLGGGYSNLYESMFGGNWLPPMTLHTHGGISLFGVIDAETNQEFALNHYSFDGSGSVSGVKIIDNLNIKLSWIDPIYAQAGLTINLFDAVVGKGVAYFSPYFCEGWASVMIRVPKYIPLVGGINIAGAEVGVNTQKIWGEVRVIGIPIGVTYYWTGNNIKFFSDAGQIKGLPFNAMYAAEMVDDEGKPFIMGVGTNTHLIASSQENIRFGKPGEYTNIAMPDNAAAMALAMSRQPIILATADSNSYSVKVENGQMGYMQITYQGEKPNIKVSDPNGADYPLIASDGQGGGNYIEQVIPASSSQSGKEEKYLFVSITNPINGYYKVESDKSINVALIGVDPLPELLSVGVTKVSDSSVKVDWAANNANGAEVSIYMVKDASDVGILLKDKVDATAGTATLSVPETLATGDYKVRVTMKKGYSSFANVVSDNSVNLINVNQPAAVSSVAASNAGNGYLSVNVTDSGTNVDGYVISAYDTNGNPVDSIGQKLVPKGGDMTFGGWKTAKTIIGTNPDGTNIYGPEQKVGLEPGKTYKIGVQAYKKVGANKVTSDLVLSEAVTVNVPAPANIAASFGDMFKKVPNPSYIQGSTDESIKEIQGANSKNITFGFTSDQEVNTIVKLDDKNVASKSGSAWNISLDAEDGTHRIEFISKNAGGDITRKVETFIVDTTAPTILINGPKSGADFSSGTVNLEGIFEKGAKYTIKVDGKTLKLNDSLDDIILADGSSSIPLTVDTGRLCHDLYIEATDSLGNSSIYNQKVADGSVGAINSVYIKQIGKSKAADVNIKTGDQPEFALYGVDNKGREVELNTAQASWEILSGSGIAAITQDGVLTGQTAGDVVILGSYALEEAYSKQDAVAVHIEGTQTNPSDPGTPENPADGDNSSNINVTPGTYNSEDNTIYLKLSNEELLKMIDAASDEKGKKRVLISVPENAAAKNISIEIPKNIIMGTGDIIFDFKTQLGTFSIPSNMLTKVKGIEEKKDSTAVLNISAINSGSLSAEIQNRIGNRPVIQLSLKVDGQPLEWNNPDAKVEVALPYQPSGEELQNPELISACFIDSKGIVQPVPSGRYDSNEKCVKFFTKHFSYFSVGYNMKSFNDISDYNWAQKSIETLAAKGVINGTTEDTYSPGSEISRADFILMLVKALQLDDKLETSIYKSFDDVEGNEYYAKAIAIAKKLDIAKGSDDGLFHPMDSITRQDMMVLSQRALMKIGELEGNTDISALNSFKDKMDISNYAVNAVAMFVKKGLVVGNDGLLNPTGNTSRAEMAVILYRIYKMIYGQKFQ